MKWKELTRLAKQLPAVTETIWYRTPALAVSGKGFVRLKEDGETVVFMTDSVDEQEALIDAQPDIFFITDHYRGYAAVLARLAVLVEVEARLRLERAWRAKAPRTVVAQLDGKPARGAKPAKRAPAKRAPAKRAPAKRAPAKRAPAKRARRGRKPTRR